jgi:hypothetical protein
MNPANISAFATLAGAISPRAVKQVRDQAAQARGAATHLKSASNP